jgi:pSer/pThr/pTyr-binding forkhead associated (FHA) protein
MTWCIGLLCALGVVAQAAPRKLVIVDDDDKQTVVPLLRDELTIGRAEGNLIRLSERDVSPHHARLVRTGARYFVEDLRSDNGTRVNGVTIRDRIPLDESSLVELGGYRLFITSAQGGVAPPRPSSIVKPSRLAKSSLPRSPAPESKKRFKVAYAAKTDLSDERAINADYFLIRETEVLFVVTNGPNNEPGADASKRAAEAVDELYKRTQDENATWPYPMDRALDYSENRLLCAVRVARAQTAAVPVGLAAAVVNGVSLVVAQVAKAPIYRIRSGKIERLVPAETAAGEIHIRTHALEDDDIVILASAGLAASLTDSAILATVQRAGHDMKDAAAELVELAKARGAESATVQLLWFRPSVK